MHRTREYRLAQQARVKAKWLRRVKQKKFFNEKASLPRLIPGDQLEPRILAKWLGLVSATPKPNQCQCCCSPRYSCWYSGDERLTLQERRDKQRVAYDLREEV